MRTLTLYESSGQHPLIQQFNQKVRELKELDKEIDAAERLSKPPSPRYRLTSCYTPTVCINSDEKGCVRFVAELSNRSEREEYMRTWGHINGFWDEKINSVGYRLVNNVLCRVGGGNLIIGKGGFQDIITMSDEEWQQCLALHIPDRLRSNLLEP